MPKAAKPVSVRCLLVAPLLVAYLVATSYALPLLLPSPATGSPTACMTTMACNLGATYGGCCCVPQKQLQVQTGLPNLVAVGCVQPPDHGVPGAAVSTHMQVNVPLAPPAVGFFLVPSRDAPSATSIQRSPEDGVPRLKA